MLCSVIDSLRQLLGIISERDVIQSLGTNGARALEMTAGQLMTRALQTASPQTTAAEVLRMMTAGRFHHVPVLENGELVGLISIDDLVKAIFMEQAWDIAPEFDGIISRLETGIAAERRSNGRRPGEAHQTLGPALVLRIITDLWKLARKVEDLFELQTKVRGSLDVIASRLDTLEARMTKLDAEKRELVTEAKTAATAASTMVASSVLSDAVTRITRLEHRAEQIESRGLLAPSNKRDQAAGSP